MRKWLTVLALAALVAIVTIASIGPGAAPPASAGVATQLHLELLTAGAPGKPSTTLVPAIPGNCSSWQELFPTVGTLYHQDDYTDNGDGVVSACDIIKLNGTDYHIVWAGPTYWTTCMIPGVPPTTVVYEPTQPSTGGNPICETWHEIIPNFCQQIHIDDWQDNGDGVVSVCDMVYNITPTGAPASYHIDRIECDITVEPVTTPVEGSTWGQIKSLFRELFH